MEIAPYFLVYLKKHKHVSDELVVTYKTDSYAWYIEHVVLRNEILSLPNVNMLTSGL